MIRTIAIAATAAGLSATAAAAIPPPPEVAVVVVGGGFIPADQWLARLAPEGGGGWLRLAAPGFEAADFAACQGDAEPCVREVLASRGAARQRPPTVVVLVGPGPGFLNSFTCVGVGDAPRQPERQRISVDFMQWSAAGSDPEAEQALAGCITAAASESGW